MPRDKYKDIEINGYKFRIGLVSALVGDWIVTQMMSHNFTDEAVYERAQNHLLGACSIYLKDDAPPLKIFDGGRWLVSANFPDLEYDTEVVHMLLNEALEFTTGPFFRRLKKELDALKPTPATAL